MITVASVRCVTTVVVSRKPHQTDCCMPSVWDSANDSIALVRYLASSRNVASTDADPSAVVSRGIVDELNGGLKPAESHKTTRQNVQGERRPGTCHRRKDNRQSATNVTVHYRYFFYYECAAQSIRTLENRQWLSFCPKHGSMSLSTVCGD